VGGTELLPVVAVIAAALIWKGLLETRWVASSGGWALLPEGETDRLYDHWAETLCEVIIEQTTG